jgi:hypothetical protein
MARNNSGVYTLPQAGLNPVVSKTSISRIWANTTLGDIANELTNSLDRTGRGAMTQPLQLPDGSAALPSLTFSNDLDTGVFRAGTNQLGLVCGGATKVQIGSTALTIAAGMQLAPNSGTVGAPTYSFGPDLTSGLYRAGAGDVRMAISGADVAAFAATGTTFAAGITGPLTITGALSVTGALSATAGLTTTQSTANGTGGDITGNGSGTGLNITGGSTGAGARIEAGAGGNGAGLVVTPRGTGIGLDVQSLYAGRGVSITGNATQAPLRLVPQSAPSGANGIGDLYIDSSGILYSCTVAGTPGTFTKVGTQT